MFRIGGRVFRTILCSGPVRSKELIFSLCSGTTVRISYKLRVRVER
jgi:hypothetical protein